nr:hypothetical protein [uncultured Ruminococcus sp.]
MRCSKCNTEFDSEYCPNCGKKAKKPSEDNDDLKKRIYATIAVILFVLSIVSTVLIVSLVKDYNSNSTLYDKLSNLQSALSDTGSNDNSSDQSTDYENNDTDSDDDNYTEDNDNDDSSSDNYDDDDSDYSDDDSDDDSLTDEKLKELYNQQIDEYYENYGSDTTVTSYDINGDGVDELILSHGKDTYDWTNDVYDFSDGNISPVGSFRNHVTFYKPKGDDDGVISVWRTMGYQEISQITIDDEGRLNVKTIDEKQIASSDKGYQGNRIETYILGDYFGEKEGAYDNDNETISYYDMNATVDSKNWEIHVTDAYNDSDDYPTINVKCKIKNISKSDKRFIMIGNVQLYVNGMHYDGIGTRNNEVIASGESFDTSLEFSLTDLSVDDLKTTDVFLSVEGTNILLDTLRK